VHSRKELSRQGLARYSPAVAVTLGTNITRLRERAGLSRREINKRLGRFEGSTYAADLENNRYKSIRLDKALALAVALGVSLEELVRGIHGKYDDLMRQTRRLKTAQPAEEVAIDVPAIEARVRESVQAENAQVLGAIAAHASDIIKLGGALSQNRDADTGPAPHGRVSGKGRR
jgi:transcriptional regulator with XRE-family HTH domain